VGFDVLTTCQPSTVWCSRERLPAAAAQPAQGSSEPVAPRDIYIVTHIFVLKLYQLINFSKVPHIQICIGLREQYLSH
jgi:hypothetical protein